jgi:hypothetical protein
VIGDDGFVVLCAQRARGQRYGSRERPRRAASAACAPALRFRRTAASQWPPACGRLLLEQERNSCAAQTDATLGRLATALPGRIAALRRRTQGRGQRRRGMPGWRAAAHMRVRPARDWALALPHLLLRHLGPLPHRRWRRRGARRAGGGGAFCLLYWIGTDVRGLSSLPPLHGGPALARTRHRPGPPPPSARPPAAEGTAGRRAGPRRAPNAGARPRPPASTPLPELRPCCTTPWLLPTALRQPPWAAALNPLTSPPSANCCIGGVCHAAASKRASQGMPPLAAPQALVPSRRPVRAGAQQRLWAAAPAGRAGHLRGRTVCWRVPPRPACAPLVPRGAPAPGRAPRAWHCCAPLFRRFSQLPHFTLLATYSLLPTSAQTPARQSLPLVAPVPRRPAASPGLNAWSPEPHPLVPLPAPGPPPPRAAGAGGTPADGRASPASRPQPPVLGRLPRLPTLPGVVVPAPAH